MRGNEVGRREESASPKKRKQKKRKKKKTTHLDMFKRLLLLHRVIHVRRQKRLGCHRVLDMVSSAIRLATIDRDVANRITSLLSFPFPASKHEVRLEDGDIEPEATLPSTLGLAVVEALALAFSFVSFWFGSFSWDDSFSVNSLDPDSLNNPSSTTNSPQSQQKARTCSLPPLPHHLHFPTPTLPNSATRRTTDEKAGNIP